ncbi:MAG: hypothetical protein QFX35_01135 [Candidatus Verstraetearchaeota archaeon]|nr:hypothetical protein [Candidatus Verstraetearchaeota archaeon]
MWDSIEHRFKPITGLSCVENKGRGATRVKEICVKHELLTYLKMKVPVIFI